QAMLSASDGNRGALIRGVDPKLEQTVADFGAHMRQGTLSDLRPGEFGIVLGSELARALGARLGDSVVVITPQGTVTPAGTLPRGKSFRFVGGLEMGVFEFASGRGLVPVAVARTL